jgi:hypothetical protein
MKLSAKNIQFINNYLKNSGVEYVDIRQEMTDHVASALEEMDGDFSGNFTQYMHGNKSTLMQMNGSFTKAARNRAWAIMKANLLRPVFAIVAILLFIVAALATNYLPAVEVVDAARLLYVIVLVILLGYYCYCRLLAKNMYSVVDKLIAVSFLTSSCTNLQYVIHNPVYLLLFYSFATSFNLLLFITFHKLVLKSRVLYG